MLFRPPLKIADLAIARASLQRRGKVFVVTDAASLPSVLTQLAGACLHPKRLLTHYAAGDPWALVIASPGKPGGLEVCVLHDDSG